MHYSTYTQARAIKNQPHLRQSLMAERPLGIFVATMTGLAKICADEVASTLAAAGVEAEVHLMDGLDADALDRLDTIVIISSTYGHGDIPDNGQGFFAAIAARATLKGTRYAVFGLGDRTYADTFCNAGQKWDSLFADKGAIRLAPLERHDASAGTLAEDVAVAWATRWAHQFKKAA